MTLMCPLVFVVIGLGLGGGLFYASTRMRNRLQAIEDARPCKAGSTGTGFVKLHGTVKAVNPAELLTSPIEQKPCVYYRLVIEELRSNALTLTTPAKYGSKSSGSWVPVIEDEQAIPMVIADETGQVSVDPKEAQLDFQQSRTHANLFSSLPKELEVSLRARYKIVTTNTFLPKQMRYTEVVITQDQEVFAIGDCEIRDGKATLAKKENPLMMTFRTEEQVLRNGRIGIMVMKGLAVAFPALFLALAIYAFTSMGSTPGGNQNAPKAASKGAIPESIAKLKGASMTERAWAARKLAQTPVVKDQVSDVAPQLNSLLESTDNFYRDSALLAIKQGWGSTVNEPALKRIQQNATDAKLQKEVTAALDRIGR